ncbi:MAG: hypothetical protein SH868_04930 [Bythopirellula sp.]|nr:hypothetical protein [Bythopirellula sp.]
MLIPMTIVLPPADLLPFNEVIFHPHHHDPELSADPRDTELADEEQDPEVPVPPTPHPGPPAPGDPIGTPPSPSDPAPQPPLPGGPGPVNPDLEQESVAY